MTQDNNVANHVNTLYGELKEKRRGFTSIWKDIARYVVPLREDIEGWKQDGYETGTETFDGTAITAAKLFTDGLHSNLVSPSSQWFTLLMEKEELNEIPEVIEWLQKLSLKFFRILSNSSFYTEFWNYLYDGATIGTAIMYMAHDIATDDYIFETLHPGECYLDENHLKQVDTVIHSKRMTGKQIIQMFDNNGNVPDNIRDNPNTTWNVIHVVYPRDNWGQSKLAKHKKYASVWKLEGTNDVLRESGYDIFPYAVWRYLKSGREIYGRSPAYYALHDIKINNLIAKNNLMSAQLLTRPPLNIPVELKNKINLRPSGVNYYTDANRMVYPININPNLQAGILMEDRRREIIKEHFQLDFFYMISQSPRQMTATEIVERQGEKAVVLSASVGRLNNETLNNVIDFIFAKEYELGRLPQIPRILLENQGEPIKIEYTGLLAKAQRRLFITQSVNASMQTLIPLMQVFPEIRETINPINTAREVLRAYGFPEKAIRSDKEITELKLQRIIEAKAMGVLENAKEQENVQ